MIPAPVFELARKISEKLKTHKIPHAIAGGMAVSMHGRPRMTKDIDILISSKASNIIKSIGKTKNISGFLNGLSISINDIDIDFLFLGKGIKSKDILSAKYINGLPVVNIETLILMKMGAGRTQDTADIVKLLNLGKVDISKVIERLKNKEDKSDFEQVVQMAKAENRGKTKKARQIFFTLQIGPKTIKVKRNNAI
jgi:hypothetical protein